LVTAKDLPYTFRMVFVPGGGVAKARNTIAADFMKDPEAEYLFWYDYDLMPRASDFLTILSKMALLGLAVLGGMYTVRAPKGHWVLNFPNAYGSDENNVLLVAELGTGFKCYRKRALEQIRTKNPWLEYEEDSKKIPEWGFFSMGPVKDPLWADIPTKTRWLTEDYWLDWLTRDAGIPIAVDTTVQLYHKDGAKVYPEKFPPVPPRVPQIIDAIEAERAKKELAPT
jgi:hypothetical protein